MDIFLTSYGLMAICLCLTVVQAMRRKWVTAGFCFLFTVICLLFMAFINQMAIKV